MNTSSCREGEPSQVARAGADTEGHLGSLRREARDEAVTSRKDRDSGLSTWPHRWGPRPAQVDLRARVVPVDCCVCTVGKLNTSDLPERSTPPAQSPGRPGGQTFWILKLVLSVAPAGSTAQLVEALQLRSLETAGSIPPGRGSFSQASAFGNSFFFLEPRIPDTDLPASNPVSASP